MGTKKGEVRKTARRAYVKKAKKGSVASMAKRAGQFGKKKSGKYLRQDAKKGKMVKKARNSARMNVLEELGRVDAEKKNRNRDAEKRRLVRELNSGAKKGKKVTKAKSGTTKGQVRKTARRAYMPKKAKSGTKKGQVRTTARRAYMKKGGSTRKCRSGCK